MPTDNEKLLDEITGYTQPETSKLNLQQAVNIDPDQAARDIEMARRNKLPVDTVERNRKEIENREYVNSVGNLEGFPAVEKFLSNRENAMVSVDDIENLKQTEVVLREDNVLKSAWDTFDNTSAGFFNRASTLVGNLVELTGNVGDSIRDTFDYLGVANPGIVIGDDGISFTKDLSRDIPSILTQTGKAISEGEGYEYIPHFTWERLKGDISVKNLTGYVFEQGVQSLPDMIAAIYTLPTYIASRTEEFAEERVANDERKDVEMSDLAKSLVPALGVSLIERLGARVTFGTGGVKSPLDVLKATTGATLTEGGTEFVQGGIEYLGETLGTQKDFDAAEMFDEQLAGLVAGGGVGFGIRGTTSTMEAIANRTTRSITTRVESTGEQQMLDNLITYAQSSKTRGRAQDRYADFLRGNNSPREVFITPEGIEAAKQAGVELPPSLLKQDNDIGLDTTMDVATFGTDIAANEELMKVLRPHVRLSAESLSLQEMENHQLDIQNMIQRAEQSKELKAEADRIYDEVKDQIVATGRQGESTARYSAQIIPAYATVKAEQTGLPVSEVYQRMGFSVVGPTGDPTGRTMIQDDGGSFNITEQQAITEGYDTGDVLYHGSSSDTIEGIQRGDGNMFDGLFASDDERAAKSHGDNVHKFVLKNGVASNSDLDTESSRNFLIEQLDDDYNQLSEEDFERFYDSIVFEDDSFVWDENDDLTNSLMTALRVEDVSQLSWELQRLRGQITRQQGFDAVEMSDEHGTSYLLVGDGVRRLTDDPTGRTMTQDDDIAFKRWAGTDKVIEADDIHNHDFTTEGPHVVKAHHGTTHVFTEFDATRGSKEGQFGAVNYFTSSYDDASANYAGEGPDLTNRIEQLAEQLQSSIDEYSFTGDVDGLLAEFDFISEADAEVIVDENADVDDVDAVTKRIASDMARKELSGGQEQVLDVFVRMDKPFVIGDSQRVELREEITDDELYQQVSDNTGEDVDTIAENPEDFEDAIDEARWEIEADRESPLAEAIEDVLSRYETNITPSDVLADMESIFYDTDTTSTELEKYLRDSEQLMYVEDYESGGLLQSQIIGEVIQALGYDGIVLKNAEQRFRNMDMSPNTTHIHVFDPNKTNIKSVDNRGTFDPNDANIYNQSQTPTRNDIGLYSAVEKAVLDLNIQGWSKKSTKGKTKKFDDQIAALQEQQREQDERFKALLDKATEEGDVQALDDIEDMLSDTTIEKQIRELKAQRELEATPRASGKEIWQKLKKEPGVKVEELEWLGLEEFLLSAPDKLTRDEVVSFINNNGVQVEEIETTEDSEGGDVEDVYWSEPTPLDGEEYYEHRIPDMVDSGLWDEEAYDEVIRLERDYIDANKEEGQSDTDFIDEQIYNEFTSARYELVKEAAREEYMDDPIVSITADIEGGTYEILGNDDAGYEVLTDGDIAADNIWSVNEAQLQAIAHARESRGYDDNDSGLKWESYVTEGDYTNYREIKLTLPTIDPQFEYDVHFDEPNIVSFMRLTDRELVTTTTKPEDRQVDYTVTTRGNNSDMGGTVIEVTDTVNNRVVYSGVLKQSAIDEAGGIEPFVESFKDKFKNNLKGQDFPGGYYINDDGVMLRKWNSDTSLEKDTFFIDEMQSDWHQQGRQKGYYDSTVDVNQLRADYGQTAENIRLVLDKVREALLPIAQGGIEQAQNLNVAAGIDGAMLNLVKNADDFLNSFTGESLESGLHALKNSPMATERLTQFADELTLLRKQADEISKNIKAQTEGVPDAPFKGNNWLNLALKRALVKAVEEGKDAFAWADANVLADRWSESYRKLYETQYDIKMPSMIKKLTKQTPQHIDFETGLEPVGDELGYWVIELTPELKEQIRKESFSLFQFAGQTSQTAQLDKLFTAQQMAANGASKGSIRTATGWFQGVDNQWRYEISDHDASLTGEITSDGAGLNNILNHPELFAAYPFIGNILVSRINNPEQGEKGSYNPNSQEIEINTSMTEEQQLSTLLHEIQHAIQHQEDFAFGGTNDIAWTTAVAEAVSDMSRQAQQLVSNWKIVNKGKILREERASELAHRSLMFKSMNKLIDYANHDKPSSVFRHIRNEVQWVYDSAIRENDDLRARATEIERMFYGIPRRGPKRNEHIREIAWAASQLLRDAIPEADLKLFKEDTRAVDGMVKALQRQANRARDTLKPLKAKEKDAAAAKYLAEKTQYKTPYSIYRSLAGEIEARTTQARQKLTPEERAARDPRMDEDIRADEAIIVLGSMELKIPAVARSVEQEQEPRGSITFTPNNEAIIKLGKASNLSTFLHEAGHLFLEMETRFAKEFGVTEDQQTLLDWLGVKSFDDIKVDQHEQFARGFEAYLREGKAPSVGLREAFSAFRDWLLRIYQNIMQLDVELNDEIRGVFDRMLATEAEIETALSAPNYEEFFRSQEQAGMSDEEWEKYQKTIAKRRESATRTIDEKLLAQYTRLKTAEWKEEKAPIVEQELERLSKLPVYQIIDDARQYPMDYDMLKEMVGVDKLPGKFIGLAKKGGVDPQEYAEAYGFNNVSQMYNAIVDVQPLKKTADESAEALMIEKYGDIFNDGTIEAEVREAVHNDEQASLLLQEINALKPPRAQAINTEQIRLNARNTIAKMKFTDIKPNKYNRAEIRAAQNAATATTPEDKYRFKVQQAVNHHLYREAVAAREAMIKQRKYIRGVQKRDYNTKQVAAEYVTNMKLLANMYDMRQKPERTIAIEQLLTWYETQINDENEFAQLQLLDVNLIRALAAREAGELADITLPTFDDLTVEDLRGVYDMLRHMRHVGGQMSDVAKAELQQEYAEIEASIEEHGGRNVKDQAGLPGKHTDLKRKISHLVNLLPSLRNLVRRLDGFTDGVLYDKLYRRIEDANSRKLKLGAEMYQRFEEELNDLHKIGLNRKDHKTYITDDGMEIDISSEHRFMMALYWGTESSRDAIRDGWGLTDNDVSRILADMPDEQVDVLNKVWAVNETMWPDLSAASVRLYGVAPPKLDATPFSINGKQLSGGHMRLFYDSSELEMKAEQEDAAKMATIVPSRAGSLYERVGSGGRAPLLDVNNMIRAIEDNVHFIAFAETGRQIAGIMNNKNIQAVMERKHGRGFRKAMIQNLENITSNRPAKETLPFVPQLSRLLRKAATFKYLSYSLRNAVQGLGAIPIAMEEVGITAWTGALARFASPAGHKEVVSFVQERSQFMTQRSSLVNREAAEHLNKIKLTGKAGHAWDVFVKYGFTPQTIIDSVIAYPVWIAKYEASMEVHGDESRAASEADTAVAESVGSGSDLHLGGVFQQNNTEFVKTMTVFGSWFNAYYQRVYKSTGGFNEFANVDAFKTIVTTPFIVAALSAALIMDLPEDGGDEEWWSWMLSRYAGFMAGTVPLLRDIYSSAGGFTPKTPLAGASEIPIRFANEVKAVMKGDQSSLKTTSDLINITTTVVPVPGAGNVTRVLNFVDSNAQGNETGSAFAKTYQALVEGPNRNK